MSPVDCQRPVLRPRAFTAECRPIWAELDLPIELMCLMCLPVFRRRDGSGLARAPRKGGRGVLRKPRSRRRKGFALRPAPHLCLCVLIRLFVEDAFRREDHDRFRASMQLGFQGEGAAVKFDETLDDRQAEA